MERGKALTPFVWPEYTAEELAEFERQREMLNALDWDVSPTKPPQKARLVTVQIPVTEPTYQQDHWPHLKRPKVRVSDKTYVIVSEPFVKIGIAHDVEARFRALMATNPHPMKCVKVLLGGRPVERALHQRFAAHRHRDEWFRIEGKLAEWIKAGCPYE